MAQEETEAIWDNTVDERLWQKENLTYEDKFI